MELSGDFGLSGSQNFPGNFQCVHNHSPGGNRHQAERVDGGCDLEDILPVRLCVFDGQLFVLTPRQSAPGCGLGTVLLFTIVFDTIMFRAIGLV